MQGLIVNKVLFDRKVNNTSLENSLIASAKGCRIPRVDTLLGPLRDWDSPKIFRSIRVKKATLASLEIIAINILMIQKYIKGINFQGCINGFTAIFNYDNKFAIYRCYKLDVKLKL